MVRSKKSWQKLLLLTLFFSLALSSNFSLCLEQVLAASATKKEATAKKESRSSSAEINRVAAVVNGKIITMYDLQKAAAPDLAREGINPNNPPQNAKTREVLKAVLDGMIMDILFDQEAIRLKATASDKDIDEEILNIMRTRGLTREQFAKRLAEQKLTLEELRNNIRKNIVRQKIMAQEITRRIVITPKEIEDYYNANRETLIDRSGLHWALLVYPPNVKAQNIAEQIASGKISFLEATKKYSIVPNNNKGSDMGLVEWDNLNREWSERMLKLRPGQASGVFQVNERFKGQVYLYRPNVAVQETTLLDLQQAKPLIEHILRQPKSIERFDEYTKQLRSKAVLDIRFNQGQ